MSCVQRVPCNYFCMFRSCALQSAEKKTLDISLSSNPPPEGHQTRSQRVVDSIEMCGVFSAAAADVLALDTTNVLSADTTDVLYAAKTTTILCTMPKAAVSYQ